MLETPRGRSGVCCVPAAPPPASILRPTFPLGLLQVHRSGTALPRPQGPGAPAAASADFPGGAPTVDLGGKAKDFCSLAGSPPPSRTETPRASSPHGLPGRRACDHCSAHLSRLQRPAWGADHFRGRSGAGPPAPWRRMDAACRGENRPGCVEERTRPWGARTRGRRGASAGVLRTLSPCALARDRMGFLTLLFISHLSPT